MNKSIREFICAFRVGLPMGKYYIWRWGNIILLLLGIIALIGGVAWSPILGNPVIRIVIWAIIAISFGLIPYWGQKLITEDYKKIVKGYTDNLFEARKELENQKQENARLKRQFENKQ